MFEGLKTSAAVLIGLLVGVIVALPLAWYGTRLGADSLRHNIERSVLAVEQRQQAMADATLKLEELLVSKGHRKGGDIFEKVMEDRSRLAGVAELEAKLEAVQNLEQGLLLSEKIWEYAADSKRVRDSFYYGEHGRVWEKQKRLLVREQDQLTENVVELNRLLQTWPASVLLAYKSVGAMINAMLGDVMGKIVYTFRWGLDWVGYGARRMAALTGQQAPPEPPTWKGPKGSKSVAYTDPIVPPRFLADAPPPENEYDELQYTRETRDYADVEIGQDPAVLENRNAPEGYGAVAPKPQSTVTYK